MNIEYIKLSDGTTAVTNGKGIIEKRLGETSSEELMLENKIEAIDNSVQETNKMINDRKGVLYLSKNMLKCQPFLLVLLILNYLLGNVSNGIYSVFKYGIMLCGVATLFWGAAYFKTKRKLNGLIGKLRKAEELKSEYEDVFNKLKEKKKSCVEEQTIINKPISLVQQNETELPIIDKELEDAYYNSLNFQIRRLRKRK